MSYPAPDKLSKNLCKAIAGGDISRVKRLCRKRQKTSKDSKLGTFSVVVDWFCDHLVIPNAVLCFTKTATADCWTEKIEYFDPPKLCTIICAGECDCMAKPTSKPVTRQISPLVVACYYGHIKIVQYLLKVEPEAVNFNDYVTPLMITTLCRNKKTGVEIAKILVDAGADINIVDKVSGWHALEFAGVHRNYIMINFLLKMGVDINSVPLSPLINAETERSRRFLLKKGAVVLNPLLGRCPFFHALVSKASIGCFRDYVKSPSFQKDHVYLDWTTTLMQFCFYYHCNFPEKYRLKILDLLLRHGVPVDSYMPSEDPDLLELHEHRFDGVIGPATFSSVRLHLPKTVKFLLEHGADVNFRNEYGMTALMILALYYYKPEDRKTLSILSEYSINIGTRDNLGNTPVYYAIANDHENLFMLEWLLKRNVESFANGDRRLCKKKSLFHIACQIEEFKRAQLLIDYGYNIRKETWLMEQRLWPEEMRQDENVSILHEFLSSFQMPDNLRCLCRNEIRGLLGINISVCVKQLGLPGFLQDYLLFN